MDPLTILAAIAPILVQGGKAAISRWIAPAEFKASSIDEYVKMKEVDLGWFKALNEAGGTNPTYLWVEAVVRLMRPTVALIVMAVWADAHGFLSGAEAAQTAGIDNFAAAIGFYLFGDRTLFYANKKA